MTLSGLSWSALFGVFGAVAAATALLYVLKLRRRAVPVPFAPIWKNVLRARESSRFWSQLKRWLSLLLQLLLLSALVLSLGDPRLGGALGEGKNIVLLMDASASMKATDEKPNRLGRAREEARRLVRGLGPSDRAVVVQMGMLPTARGTLTGEQSELLASIDKVRARDTGADLGRALRFASDSLHGLSRGQIVLLTDGALKVPERPETDGLSVSQVIVGKGKDNLSITQFSARRYPLDKSRVEVMIEVTNTNDHPADIELSLLGDGTLIDVTRLHLGPEERLPRFYPDVAGASRRLEARIASSGDRPDQLPADDRAYALMPERRRARVLVVTPGNTYLEAALLLDEYLDVSTVAPKKYPPAGAFDVTIFDGVAPVVHEKAGACLYLNPPAEGAPVKRKRRLSLFGFDTWERRHPVVRFATALGDVQVAEGYSLVPEKGDTVVGASAQGPILVAGKRQGHRFVALGFDPRQSDFVLRPAWPLFVLSTIDFFAEEEAGYVSSYRTGESWRIPAPDSLESAELLTPSGQRLTVPIQGGRAAYFGEEAGFYRLSAGAVEPFVEEFAANLSDLEESRIAPQPDLTIAGKPVPEARAGAPEIRKKLWIVLLMAAVALSVVEWLTFHRRITV